jgi:predicted helicase
MRAGSVLESAQGNPKHQTAMSQVLIHEYLAELSRLKQASGSSRETIVREAFKDLLKGWGRAQDLVFLAEYPLKTATRANITVDGALLHHIRTPLGWWEAKDEDDDLDNEIAAKFRRGYPRDNIVFTDDVTAALWQGGNEAMRCSMTDTTQLEKLLKLFFAFERPEIAGFRRAVEQFKTDLPAVLKGLRDMIEAQHQRNAAFRAAQDAFLLHAQEAINPGLAAADVREMLIQHILTEEIFSKVFDDSDFHRQNNVAGKLYELEGTFFTGGLKKTTLKGLEPYYAAIRAAAAQIGSHSEKQTFLKVIYENFYKVYNAKAADRLGVVYTPNEIVRFMIEGADWLCEKHFGRNLVDRDVEILDPATGTGTFICELLEHFRGQPKKLERKYREELHANEVAILPYYVANLNIEATYAAITGKYEEFANLCFVDTLDNVGLHTAAHGTTIDLFGSVSEENVARIKRQNARKISVIIGNPPYNANQANENDNNKNREYPAIDARIKQTYIAQSTAQKTKLYDMYARFFRWASDRLAADGVLAFVTNRSFIDSRTFDGFRKTVGSEFAEAYVVDLGGDVRANPKLSGTRHNVFGIQTGVAISFLVKREGVSGKKGCRVFYARRPEMETAEEKLSWLAVARASRLGFEEVRPDANGNWINVSSNDFEDLIPIVSKAAKAARSSGQERAIFKTFGFGVSTNRDEWVYDDSAVHLATKIIAFLGAYAESLSKGAPDSDVKWSRNLKRKLEQRRVEDFNADLIVPAAYRPFCRTYLYDSKLLIDERGIRDSLPRLDEKHIGHIIVTDPTAQKPWLACAVAHVPDLHFVGAAAGGICLPIKLAAQGGTVDNITDWALKKFLQHYHPSKGRKPAALNKQAIFHYVYAVLHDPLYRERYGQNLKRDFPRVPLYGSTLAHFEQWAAWGEELMQLHIGYETVAPWPLTRSDTPDTKARAAGQQPSCMLKSLADEGRIVIDSETVLAGIPPQAWDYRLGNRSALDWVLDQHKEKKPKDPTIRERFNTYRFADHKERVLDLLARVTRVSVETVRIVAAMQAGPR